MSGAPSAISRAEALKVFWFLVDAPMFIDTALVERLHDAIIRPDSIVTGGAEQAVRTAEQGREYGLTGEGDVNVPFVVKMAVKGEFGHTYSRTDETGKTQQFSVPRTSERLLEELVAFYLKYFPSRVITVNPSTGEVRVADDQYTYPYSKLDEVCAISGPRPLILVDAPPGSKLMPMAGEFADGTVDVTYDRLIEELSKGGAELHRFERHSKRTAQDKTAAWAELINSFDARLAMHVL